MPVPYMPSSDDVVNTARKASPSWLIFWGFVSALFHGSPGTCTVTWGTGSPNGVVVAPVASLYLRIDGGANTTLYVKEVGTDSAGWTGK